MDAVVVDGKGNPVPGLEREDFVLTEDGRPQEIATFEAFEDEARPPSVPADMAEPATLVTNERSPTSPGRAYGVLLDDVWIPATDGPAVRGALKAFLERSVRIGDQVILATTSGDLQWSARIPEGREELLGVLARFSGGRPGQDVFVNRLGSLNTRTEYVDTMTEYEAHRVVEGHASGNMAIAMEIEARRRDRMRLTHAALRRELEELSGLGGRKSLLLITQGFLQDSGPELHETTRIAHEANVAIHFLDVRGLLTTPGYSADFAGSPDPSRVAETSLDQNVIYTAGSQDLAADTGGFSVRNTNDLAPGLDRIAVESRVFYLLGFHPPPGKSPGEWRQLRVEVRRPGLTVRARRGYTWRATSDRSGPIRRPADSVPLRLASYVLEPADAEKTRVTVVVEVDGGGLAPDAPNLVVRFEAIPRDGGDIHSRDLLLDRSNSGRLDVALPNGVYRLRAAIEDPATGRRGHVEQRVVIPGAALLRTSTPVLSDTLVPTTEPGGSPVPAPVAHRTFRAEGGRPLLLAFDVLGAARDPATGRSDVRMGLVVKDHSGRVQVEARDAPLAPSPGGRLEQVVGLPLAQMAGGEYELELTIHDRVAGKVVERREAFVVEAALAPPSPHAAVAPDLAPLLERAGRYVIAYQETFSDLVAEESYQQEMSGRSGHVRRHSRADMLFVSLPGPIPWAVFRDVYEVDGKKVRDREARLERLFRDSTSGAAGAAAKAKSILDESARFNLGPVRRTLNVPTFALLVLHPKNQHRFSFERTGRTSINGAEVVGIAFTEKVHPTLVAGADGDIAAKGNLWIDAEQGTVLRTEIWYGSGANYLRRTFTRIVTEYEREPRLQVTVPVRMTETYESAGSDGLGAGVVDDAGNPRGGLAIKAVARYSGYRRFQVTTDETFDSPPEK